jgi:hypothetical protein
LEETAGRDRLAGPLLGGLLLGRIGVSLGTSLHLFDA